jgi:hypothetical protein
VDRKRRVVFFENREPKDLFIWSVTAVEMLGQATDDIRKILKSPESRDHKLRVEKCQKCVNEFHEELKRLVP